MLKTVIVLILLALASPLQAQENSSNRAASERVETARQRAETAAGRSLPTEGFRGIPWGASPEQVILKEGTPARRVTADGKTTFLYEDVLLGMKTQVFFSFVNDKLAVGLYDVPSNNLADRQVLAKFFETKRFLESKYGPAVEGHQGPSYAFDSDSIALFVKLGQAELRYAWEYEDCFILLNTHPDRNELNIGFRITYYNQTLYAPAEAADVQREKNKL